MTEVAFHVNVPDPVAYACRLTRKAYLRGMSVLVLGDARQVASLDERLWSMRPVEFLPHCRDTDDKALLQRSSVVLSSDMAQVSGRPFDALLNLTSEVPSGYSAFERLFEVVSLAEVDLQAARHRWRAYLSDGQAPIRHEIAG